MPLPRVPVRARLVGLDLEFSAWRVLASGPRGGVVLGDGLVDRRGGDADRGGDLGVAGGAGGFADGGERRSLRAFLGPGCGYERLSPRRPAAWRPGKARPGGDGLGDHDVAVPSAGAGDADPDGPGAGCGGEQGQHGGGDQRAGTRWQWCDRVGAHDRSPRGLPRLEPRRWGEKRGS
ncbi:hypothetical protein BN6_33920 [Saccharothrix espanaensis DSM 44229]|uniref:Uncharacterized protein n=1 Tax=Saccharothrix espanaensis (strain ATCC 51144 / DSM 44229 / JCM 9112 / NBRC 15066 / NRRL 15764) TaxID=1179773 RepID=K0JSL0_SACES|nr:hypothetical protein BN6_33920 [Saccharothrix espanaensis DSM 44229]